MGADAVVVLAAVFAAAVLFAVAAAVVVVALFVVVVAVFLAAGARVVFLTTVDVLSLLALLEALTRRVAAAREVVVLVAVVAAGLLPRVVPVDAAAELELVLTVDAVVALRTPAARVAFAFSTMVESRPAPRWVVGGLVGDAGRAMRDLVGEGGGARFLGVRRELEDVGERIWAGWVAATFAPRVLFLGFSMPSSFSLSGPTNSSLFPETRKSACYNREVHRYKQTLISCILVAA